MRDDVPLGLVQAAPAGEGRSLGGGGRRDPRARRREEVPLLRVRRDEEARGGRHRRRRRGGDGKERVRTGSVGISHSGR